MKENIIVTKSFDFVIQVVETYKILVKDKKEFVLSKQFLESGTSIGANVSEAVNAPSKVDFKYKLTIALKECNETEYWIKLMYKTEYLEKQKALQLGEKCIELNKILRKIIKTCNERIINAKKIIS
ncbi:four helix bundle protein [Clostridium sartagoforme]|uniref:Four helix bundle protein n=1 Tax=Clostridium sartagoforme TaxID=84031 RepID=A0A4S2DM79_9CLOT|nr:four helix bundle protein [Clostridium sartagoforme]TGY42124.1 four helix bundle protein [Clostridium sartagoforme]